MIVRKKNMLLFGAGALSTYLLNAGLGMSEAVKGGDRYKFHSTLYEAIEKRIRRYAVLPICMITLCFNILWGCIIVRQKKKRLVVIMCVV